MANVYKLNIASYNCEGINRTSHYINDLLDTDNLDILCLQETWLLDEQHDKLQNLHDNYLPRGKSGVDSETRILQGRPSGGVAILYKKSIARHIQFIDIDSKRACGIIINTSDNNSILCLCIYMPCDNYSTNVVTQEYMDTLDSIESALSRYNCHGYIICGDFNTSFQRNNAQTVYLQNFMQRNSLDVFWQNSNVHVGNTYTNYALNHFSCIDHFIMSNNLFTNIEKGGVRYDPTNPSNHNVVNIIIDHNVSHVRRSDSHTVSQSRCTWHKASDVHISNYVYTLNSLLNDIDGSQEALTCCDSLCSNVTHKKQLDKLCNELVLSCIVAGAQHIPQKSCKRIVPGWNEHV